MIFIRHNSLKKPYDNYENLSIAELDDLAHGNVSTPIEEITSLDGVDIQVIQQLKNAEYAVCSESERTQFTCKAILSLLNLDIPIKIDARLNEIMFTPSKIITETDDINPLHYLRNALFEHMLQESLYVDSKLETEARINSLFNEYHATPTVCFTHGFLMRLIHAYSDSNKDIDYTLQNIPTYPPVKYLQVMSINQL